jgi:hypothetical protein
MRTPKNKQLTFEQISELYDIPISEVNTHINNAYNKMVTELVKTHHIDIWDAVVGMKEFLGISEKESVEKLNRENLQLLKKSASTRKN